MSNAITTKLTKGGQTTVPKEIRLALGIDDESRVWWHLEDGRAILSAEAPIPNQVGSVDEFWAGVHDALDQAASGAVRDASRVSGELRQKYGL